MRGHAPPRPSARDKNPALPSVNEPTLPGNTREGRAERARWNEYLTRKAAAADRARTKRERQKEEWKAEIAQFGEEARRRRLEEIQVNKDLEKLTTSEVEYEDGEDIKSDPTLTILALLRVNGKTT